MKKYISIILLICIIISICTFSFGYKIDEYYLLDPYEITDHDELVELYDNLRSLYEQACEDASSYEDDLEEQHRAIEELKEKLNDVNIATETERTNIVIYVILAIGIIVFIIYQFAKDWFILDWTIN